MSTAPGSRDPLQMFAALLQLEKLVLDAETLVETRYVIANATRTLSPFVQSILFSDAGNKRLRVSCVSNVSDVDRASPYVAWAERLAAHLIATNADSGLRVIEPDQLTPTLRRDWAEFASACLLWIPLFARGQQRRGALLLSRETSWTPQELALLTHLATIYGHALDRHHRQTLAWRSAWRPALLSTLTIAVVAGISIIPIRLSVVAPAEIVARDAFVVAAPIDGVVRQLHVVPNQPVQPDALLAELESGDLKGVQDVAAKALEVSQAELRRSQQASFLDPARKADLALLQAQVDLRLRELQLAQTRLSKTQMRAERSGVVVVDDPQLWRGRPVRVGERILSIADPAHIEVTILVPVKDAVALEPGNEVRLFLDTDPLNSLRGTVRYVVYESTLAGEWPAYKVTAQLDATPSIPRIGLRGTARIYGDQTTVFYYLFRRPITVARQWLGW
ncbi:MAG: efflux RND transporter periplasmic adaptor subunit [Burkholderiaceae bacterium]|jgi:multidrug resistance efflux pump